MRAGRQAGAASESRALKLADTSARGRQEEPKEDTEEDGRTNRGIGGHPGTRGVTGQKGGPGWGAWGGVSCHKLCSQVG